MAIEHDNERREVRLHFLLTLLARAKHLRNTRSPPASYSLGEEYFGDPKQIDCRIRVTFVFPGVIRPQQFWHNKSRLTISQRPPLLTIEIERKVPSRLWDDLRLLQRGQEFFIGYVSALMPAINRRLLANRYLSGQPLSRTFFLLEAAGISAAHLNDEVRLRWPVTVAPFARSAELAPGRAEAYLRDFVDAIHSLLKNDFEDCIRRVVTTVETFFELRKWTAGENKPPPVGCIRRTVEAALGFLRPRKRAATIRPNSFRNVLAHNISTTSLPGRVVLDNLKFVYHVRNKIVHRGLRMSMGSGAFCCKAIETLRYFIQRYSGDISISRYAHSLGMHLLMVRTILGQSHDLDLLRKMHSVPAAESATIESPVQLDDFVFMELRFTDQDKSSIV